LKVLKIGGADDSKKWLMVNLHAANPPEIQAIWQ